MTVENQSISAVVITKNETANIAACLESVAWADEIVVLDSGSADRTVEISRQYTSKVFVEPWRGMGAQKNRAIDLAQGPWIFQLDADERAVEGLEMEIRQAITRPEPQAYSLRRKNYYRGQWIRHCGWWPDRVVRVFLKGSARFSEEAIHASLQGPSTVGRLTHPIVHHSFKSPEDFMNRARIYACRQAEEMHHQGRRATAWTAVSHGVWSLVHTYFIRLGFLDGAAGLLISVSNFMGVFYRYMMIRDLNRNRPDDAPGRTKDTGDHR